MHSWKKSDGLCVNNGKWLWLGVEIARARYLELLRSRDFPGFSKAAHLLSSSHHPPCISGTFVAIELIGSVAALIVVLILWLALRDRKPPD
jgi:hypothetical protein